MATEKKHQDLTGAESQRLGKIRDSNSAEAQALRAKVRAQRYFAELEEVERQAGAVHLGPGVAAGGVQREQEAADAQLIGRHPDPRSIRDAELRQKVIDARERIRRGNEVREAPEHVSKAQAAYDAAVAEVDRWAAKAAAESRDRAIQQAQVDLADASERARRNPAAAADVKAAAAKLEQLVGSNS